MKKILFSTMAMMAGSLLAAYADPQGDVTSAAQKLAAGSNYTWRATVVVPADSRFKPGPTDGKLDGSMTYVKMTMRDNHTEIIMDGPNTVVTDPDDGSWTKLSDLDDSQMPGRFMKMMVQNFKAPAAQAIDLAGEAQSLQQTGNSYTGPLTDDAAKNLLMFRRGPGNNASVSNPSGTVTFWVDGGQLTKFEYHVKGTITFNGNDRPQDRDTTVVISDVGTTKIDVPADAKKLLP
ncbi:MAG TPA: hypothetical protein VMF08_03405 [Candidatus Sulfotelmatobacter sp.]|nr:hypothetical protein [Candidatus Sulfotelmatobacter sp.]